MKHIFLPLSITLVALAIASLTTVVALYLPTYQVAIRNQAIHDCAQDYRLEYIQPDQNTTVIKPIDDLYQNCLSEKGIE